jgi:hypothetical protein
VTRPPLDDQTVAYVLESQPLFEDLRQVASQLAGLLVLAATGSRDAVPDHPMLETADALFRQTIERVERTQATDRARSHRESLREAGGALGRAIEAVRGLLTAPRTADFNAALIPLRAGYDHLQHAAQALPGFRMIAFEQGCCSGHAVPSSGSLATS